MSDMLII